MSTSLPRRGGATARDDRRLPLFNRESSWLEFDRRVLAEAESAEVPLLERVKFLAITASNLDEFLMVRAGGIRQLVESGIRERSPDGRTPRQQLKAIREGVKHLQREMYRVFDELEVKLQKARIRIVTAAALTKKQQLAASEEFHARVAPVLTPLAVDPGHPLPFLPSGSLNLALTLGAGTDTHRVFLNIPRALPRFVQLAPRRFLPIEELIRMHAGVFFPGLEVREVVPFRVIRNADLDLREDEIQDLLQSIESEVRRRERKEVVWMEIARTASEDIVAFLERELDVSGEDVFLVPSLARLADLVEIHGLAGGHALRDEPFNPRIPAELATPEDLFAILRSGDVLLHRPYDSYSAVVEFVESAADDPDVLAIKQTLYRTEPGSVVVEALARAARKGKQVTAVVELQARFDEERNIAWARRLEEAGVQVVYGLMGVKTHAKICLVIRREAGLLRSYVHLSTGNYNARTARAYTDIDVLTADEAIAGDATQLLNLITGYSAETAREIFVRTTRPRRWRKLIVAPMDYHSWLLTMIGREIKHAKEGRPAQIIAKLNSLVDPEVIAALYEAADAGVRVQLIVRGICCLVPRSNLRVVSVIDRFLEHSRILLFRNGGETEVYAASGDWMPRNFFRRIEVAWPIQSPRLRDRIELQILGTCLADDAKSWRLQPDGTYRRRKPGPRPIRSQERFIDIARAEAVKLPGSEEASRRPGQARRKAK